MQLNDKVLAVIAQVAQIKGNRFASFVYRSKESGELARHNILLGFSYHNSVVNSLAELRAMVFAPDSIESLAQSALIVSFEKTLAAHEVGEQNADYTKKDTYETVSLNGVEVQGLRFSNSDNSFKIFGLSVGKTVLENGVFKTVKSAPLTIAKDSLRKQLPIGKFREYALELNALETAKLNGETLEM